MSKWKYASLLSLVITTLSGNAAAGDFYFRLGYGEAQIPEVGEFQRSLYAGIYDFNPPEKSDTYTFDLGYQINRHISVDFRYAALSDLSKHRTWTEYFNDGYSQDVYTQDGSIEFDLKSAGIATTITTDSTRPYFAGIKLGYQYWDTHWKHTNHTYGTSLDFEFNSGEVISEQSFDNTKELTSSDSGFQENYGALVGLNLASWQIGLEHMLYAIDKGDSQVTTLFVGRRF